MAKSKVQFFYKLCILTECYVSNIAMSRIVLIVILEELNKRLRKDPALLAKIKRDRQRDFSIVKNDDKDKAFKKMIRNVEKEGYIYRLTFKSENRPNVHSAYKITEKGLNFLKKYSRTYHEITKEELNKRMDKQDNALQFLLEL